MTSIGIDLGSISGIYQILGGQIGSQPAMDALEARRRIENDREVRDEIADAIRTAGVQGIGASPH